MSLGKRALKYIARCNNSLLPTHYGIQIQSKNFGIKNKWVLLTLNNSVIYQVILYIKHLNSMNLHFHPFIRGG